MKPKEKAKELFNNYVLIQESIEWGNEELHTEAIIMYEKNNDEYTKYYKELAKQSSLIAVDEILNPKAFLISIPLADVKYWQEVKQEIEKL